MFFLWIVITDYVLIDYHHEIGSSCVGYVIMSTKFNHKFIKAYYDPFKVCDQYKKCGCIDTIDGYHWTLYAGITTKTLSKASDGMHSWVRKLMIISNSNFIFNPPESMRIRIYQSFNLYRIYCLICIGANNWLAFTNKSWETMWSNEFGKLQVAESSAENNLSMIFYCIP